MKDHELLEVLGNVLQDITDDFNAVVEQYLQLYAKLAKTEPNETEIKKLEKELEQIDRKKNKLLDYILTGQMEDQEYLRRNALLSVDAKKIEEKLEEMKQKQTSMEYLQEKTEQMKRELIIEQKGIVPEDFTQGIIDLLIDRIEVSPLENGEITLKVILNTKEHNEKVYKLNKIYGNAKKKRPLESEKNEIFGGERKEAK